MKDASTLPSLRVTKDEATTVIQARIDKCQELLEVLIHDYSELREAEANARTWQEVTESALRSISEGLADRFAAEIAVPVAPPQEKSSSVIKRRTRNYYVDLRERVRRLRSMLEQLDCFPREAKDTTVSAANHAAQSISGQDDPVIQASRISARAMIITAVIGAGALIAAALITFMLSRNQRDAPAAASAAAGCEQTRFEIPKSMWNTPVGISHPCGGTTFTVFVATQQRGPNPGKLLTFRAQPSQPEGAPFKEASRWIPDGRGPGRHMSIGEPPGLGPIDVDQIDCTHPDLVSVVWRPKPL